MYIYIYIYIYMCVCVTRQILSLCYSSACEAQTIQLYVGDKCVTFTRKWKYERTVSGNPEKIQHVAPQDI